MPLPTQNDVHVNRPLTNLSIAFMQRAENFVSARVFPNIPVSKKSDTFFTYPRGSFNKDEMRERAPSTESAGGGYTLGSDNYLAKLYAFHKDIDDDIRDNADAPLNLDREATEYVTLKALIKREKLWVTKYFTAGGPGDTWTYDVDGAASASGSFDPTNASNNDKVYWSSANSTPIEDVAQGKRFVLSSTGFEPNTLVMGYPVWEALKNHADVVDRIKYSGGVSPASPALVTTQAIAALMEVDRVFVMKAIENTADDNQTASHGFIGGNHALLCYSAPSPGLMTPSAGYTFSWTGHVQAGPEGNRIRRFRMDSLKSDRVEIEMAFDQKKIAADLGYFFGGIVQ